MPEPEDDSPPSEAEVLAYLGAVADRVCEALSEGASPRVRAAVLEVLGGDEGARELLSAAFEEGRQDAVRSMLLRGGKIAAGDWSDVESPGERRLIAREESLCARCSHAAVCVVPRGNVAELLLVVTRCVSFS